VSFQRLCPNQVFFKSTKCLTLRFGEERLRPILPEFSTTIIFVSTVKGNGGLCTPKCLACLYEHLGTGFNSFPNRNVTCTGNKWWRETQRRDREGRFYKLWCWMWVPGCCTESRNCHSVQTCTFRRRKNRSLKRQAAHNLPTEHFSLCTVRHSQSAHRRALKKRESPI